MAFEGRNPDEDAEKIGTVQDAVDCIGKHAKGGKQLSRRVVVTGIGLICGVGNTTEEVWNNLLAGNGATQSSSIKMRRTTAQVAAPKLVGEPEAKPTSAPTFGAVLGPGPRVERTK